MIYERKRAKGLLIRVQITTKRRYNTKARQPEYSEGNQVLLSTRNIKLRRPYKKLVEKQISLYQIVEVKESRNAVRLSLPVFIRIYRVVNISNVIRFITREGKLFKILSNDPFNTEEIQEVDNIIGQQGNSTKRKYLIRQAIGKTTQEPRRVFTDRRIQQEYNKIVKKFNIKVI